MPVLLEWVYRSGEESSRVGEPVDRGMCRVGR